MQKMSKLVLNLILQDLENYKEYGSPIYRRLAVDWLDLYKKSISDVPELINSLNEPFKVRKDMLRRFRNTYSTQKSMENWINGEK
jgi:hypothetical protein